MIAGLDHVALTVKSVESTCEFYNGLFGVDAAYDYNPDGILLVRQIRIGGALLSIHQLGNGLDLVAAAPETGAGDFCFRWNDSIESAVALLESKKVAIFEGPVPRRDASGMESQSIYFRDPDGNLVELMARNPPVNG